MLSYALRMKLGIALFLVLVLVWDAWLYLNWGYPATISGVVWHWQQDYPLVKWVTLPLFLFLWWHWFWGRKEDESA